MFVHERERVIRFAIRLPTSGCEYDTDWLKDLVNAANDETAIFGHFALDVDGTLYYHVADQFAEGPVPLAAIKTLMNRAAFPSRIITHAIRYGIREQLTPREAIRRALGT